MAARVCKSCGREYIPTANGQKYCTYLCWFNGYNSEHPDFFSDRIEDQVNFIEEKMDEFRADSSDIAKVLQHRPSQIADINRLANTLGMSYGEFIAWRNRR